MTNITKLAQRARINAECGKHLSPAETIGLVEALEKAQSRDVTQAAKDYHFDQQADRIAELDAELEREREKTRRVMSRIAELESRTVKLPKPKNSDQGWKIDPEFINKVQDAIGYDDTCECWEGTPSMELVEAVLLAAAGIKMEVE